MLEIGVILPESMHKFVMLRPRSVGDAQQLVQAASRHGLT